jgi:hypothetical protein
VPTVPDQSRIATNFRRFALRRSGGVISALGLIASSAALGFLSCEGEYQLEPTFCDDWCLVASAEGCEMQPDECVKDCELTKASADCFALQRDLLECYEDVDRSKFLCLGQGFGAETRVSGGFCQAERDALFECEAPGIGTCLALCRSTQEEQLESVVEPMTGPMPTPDAMPDAGKPGCPLIDEPCESLCWTMFSFTSEGLSAAGITPDEVPASGGENLAAVCLQSVFLGCFGDLLPPGFMLPDAGLPKGRRSDLDEVLEECLGG